MSTMLKEKETKIRDVEKIEKNKKSKPKKKKKRITPFKIKLYLIMSAIVLIIIAGSVFFFTNYNKEEKLDVTYLNSLLEKSSELTTSKLTITGVSKFKDTGVSFINRSDFTMVYKATIRAGIDIKEVKIASNDETKIVNIIIPKSTIQEVKVDPKSIDYYDEKVALFNTNEKEDANKAQALAEESAAKEATKTGILELADSQAATLIKGILADGVPDTYEIKVTVK